MTRLVLIVLSLVVITCVVADYDSNERESYGVSGEDDSVSNEEKSSEVIYPSIRPPWRPAYIKNHEKTTEDTWLSERTADITNHEKTTEVTHPTIRPSWRTAYIKNHEKPAEDTLPSGRTAIIKSHENTTEVTLPSGKTAYIENHVDKMKESSQCGSETILFDLEPSDEEYKLMESEMQSTIRSHRSMHFSKYNITKIERVINGCLMKVYKMRQEHIGSQSKHLNERMLFYGTPYADDIVANGFDERFSNIRGMFGAGLYFTEYSSKSNQYTKKYKDRSCVKCERKMIISRVTLGNIYKSKQAKRKIAHGLVGYHSVQGVASSEPRGLKYDEYVIYRGDQAYPDYVITYTLIP